MSKRATVPVRRKNKKTPQGSTESAFVVELLLRICYSTASTNKSILSV